MDFKGHAPATPMPRYPQKPCMNVTIWGCFFGYHPTPPKKSFINATIWEQRRAALSPQKAKTLIKPYEDEVFQTEL